ncbi:dihydroorotate dehydrogenase electron transfer subunit/dihydroorotate dehydrogenase [Desulfurococcaceae archaeon AG1]|nr:dihydroorotate dehydrogenase electron transfer subunit/dihydroorotate dehydrogenase [Desulfurococcaceae archaeon AG1]
MRGRPQPARILNSRSEGSYRVLEIETRDIASKSQPGNYIMLWLPGVDEIPLAISYADKDLVEVLIGPPRGEVSATLHKIPVGGLVGVRGPFGNPIPSWGSRVLLMGSSHGISYLRFFAEKNKERVHSAILIDEEGKPPYSARLREIGVETYVAKSRGEAVELFRSILGDIDMAVICVREDLGRILAEMLIGKGVEGYLCVERPIKCSLGLCGACDLGLWRTCIEGIFLSAGKIVRTEYGLWTRDRSGLRIPISGSIDEGPKLPQRVVEKDPELSINIAGLELPNPLMNAAGCGVSGSILYRFALEGAGAVVTKSIGIEPRKGFRGPVMIEDPVGVYMNALGLPNPGADQYVLEIRDAKRAGVPVIASIFGRNSDEYVEVAKKLYGSGVDAFELNVSCPHTEFEMVEDIPELVRDIVRSIKSIVKLPVFVKISINSDYMEVARKAIEGGADGITAINTVRSYAYDPVFKRPVMGSPNGYGGVSGPSLKPIVRRVIKDLRGEFSVPIIASGGIDSARDVIELAMLGARGFQICSAIAYKGFSVFKEILEDLRKYIRSSAVKSFQELIKNT